MAHAGGRPTLYNADTVKKVYDYINERLNEKQVPTRQGLSLYLGINLSTVDDWEDKYSEFSSALSSLMSHQHDQLLNKGLDGSYNSTIAKLVLSSNHGYKEKSENDQFLSGSIELAWLNEPLEKK